MSDDVGALLKKLNETRKKEAVDSLKTHSYYGRPPLRGSNPPPTHPPCRSSTDVDSRSLATNLAQEIRSESVQFIKQSMPTETYTCPSCGAAITDKSSSRIEREEDVYCDIDCLNEEVGG